MNEVSFVFGSDRHDCHDGATPGFPVAERVRCDFAPHIDHTVTTIAVQQQLIAAIRDWATEVRVAAR